MGSQRVDNVFGAACIALSAATGLFAADGAVAERILADWRAWPVAELEMQQANAEPGADGWLIIRAGRGASRPGIHIRPQQGMWDLDAFCEIAVPVRNVSSKPVRAALRLEGAPAQGAPKALRANPDTAGENIPAGGQPVWLTVPLGSGTGAAWANKLLGIQTSPPELVRRGSVDATKIAGVWVHVPAEQSIEIGPIVARGRKPRLEDASSEQVFPLVDEFGQYAHGDWAGKLHAEKEFTERRATEEKDLDAHSRPADWDRYGGWAQGPKRQATGFFRVEKIDGYWWMVDPEGNLFWSNGVVRAGTRIRVGTVYHGTPIQDREYMFRLPPKHSPPAAFFDTEVRASRGYYEDKEGHAIYDYLEANLWRKYGPQWSDEYSRMVQRRLASWGLNSIANSSDPAVYNRRQTPYTAIVYSVPLGRSDHRIAAASGDWGGLPDPFDPGLSEVIVKTLKTDLKDSLNDAWCMGFFVDNELHWGDSCYPAETALASPAEQPAKKAMLEDLKAKYGDVVALNKAWGTQHANWDALLAATAKPDRKQAAVRQDLEAFSGRLMDAYFRLCRDSIRAASPNHMYLGCRFAGSNRQVLETAVKYADIVSMNRYTYTVADLALPEGLDKPIVIGEFSFCGMDRGAAWPSWFLPVSDQRQRAAAYGVFMESALRNPAIIGAHWFQLYDQPVTGRFDGENFQFGLLDTCDTPYPEIVGACRKTGAALYTLRSQAAKERGVAR